MAQSSQQPPISTTGFRPGRSIYSRGTAKASGFGGQETDELGNLRQSAFSPAGVDLRAAEARTTESLAAQRAKEAEQLRARQSDPSGSGIDFMNTVRADTPRPFVPGDGIDPGPGGAAGNAGTADGGIGGIGGNATASSSGPAGSSVGGSIGGAIGGVAGAIGGAAIGGPAGAAIGGSLGANAGNALGSSVGGANAAAANAANAATAAESGAPAADTGDAAAAGNAAASAAATAGESGAPGSDTGDAAAAGNAAAAAAATAGESGAPAGDTGATAGDTGAASSAAAAGDAGAAAAGGDGGAAGGGDGGCFITEAVMSAGGQGDGAPELEVLRQFRDQVMMASPLGQALVQEYQAIAPIVVDAVSMRPDAMQIFQQIKAQFIDQAVQAVQQGDNQTALRVYADMLAFVTPFAIEAQMGPGGEGADRVDDGQEAVDDFGSHAAMIAHSPEAASAVTGDFNQGGGMPMQAGMPQSQQNGTQSSQQQPPPAIGQIFAQQQQFQPQQQPRRF